MKYIPLLLLLPSLAFSQPEVSINQPVAYSYLIPYTATPTGFLTASYLNDNNFSTGLSDPYGTTSILIEFPSPRVIEMVEAWAVAGPAPLIGGESMLYISYLNDDGSTFSSASYDVALPLRQYAAITDSTLPSRAESICKSPPVKKAVVYIRGGKLVELRLFQAAQ